MAFDRGPITTVIEVANAVRPALEKIGIVGELDVLMSGSRSVSWMGEPSGSDVVVVITIEPMPPKPVLPSA